MFIKLITIISLLLVLFSIAVFADDYYSKNTQIIVHNPYILKVSLELKCDWNSATKKYNFHRNFYIKGKHSTVIVVRNKQKICEIWPKVKFF